MIGIETRYRGDGRNLWINRGDYPRLRELGGIAATLPQISTAKITIASFAPRANFRDRDEVFDHINRSLEMVTTDPEAIDLATFQEAGKLCLASAVDVLKQPASRQEIGAVSAFATVVAAGPIDAPLYLDRPANDFSTDFVAKQPPVGISRSL